MDLKELISIIKNNNISENESVILLNNILKQHSNEAYVKGYEDCRNDNRLIKSMCSRAKDKAVEELRFYYNENGIDSLSKLARAINKKIIDIDDIDNYSNILILT